MPQFIDDLGPRKVTNVEKHTCLSLSKPDEGDVGLRCVVEVIIH